MVMSEFPSSTLSYLLGPTTTHVEREGGRERGGEREGERERGRERGGEREREIAKEGERGSCVISINDKMNILLACAKSFIYNK